MIEQLRSQSNSESLILSIDGQILSSTLNGTENYDIEDIYSKQIVERISHDHSVYTTKLLLDDIPSSLVISSILRSVNIAKLEKNFNHCVKKNEIKKVAELLISNYKRNRLKVDQFLFPSNGNEYYFLAISCIEVISF